jgi:hypothetical protein
MHTRSNALRWLPIALAAALCLGAVAPRPSEAPSPQARAMALTWKLIANVDDARQDPGALALAAFEPPPDQAGRLRELGRQQAAEKARLLEQLSNVYAGKVREALDDAQRARYDTVMAALAGLAGAESAARDSFIKAAGLTVDQADALPPGYVPTSDLTRYLDVDDAARDRVNQIQADADSAREKALIDGMDPSTWQDVESWRKHREAYALAQEQAQEDYDKQLATVLKPDQVKKLQALETAADQYRKSLDAARQDAYQKLYAALQPPKP